MANSFGMPETYSTGINPVARDSQKKERQIACEEPGTPRVVGEQVSVFDEIESNE